MSQRQNLTPEERAAAKKKKAADKAARKKAAAAKKGQDKWGSSKPKGPKPVHVPRDPASQDSKQSSAKGGTNKQKKIQFKGGHGRVDTKKKSSGGLGRMSDLFPKQWEKEQSLSLKIGFSQTELHPDIVRVGLQMASGLILGSNARAVAFLTALKAYVASYSTPAGKRDLSEDMLKKLKLIVRFMDECRQNSVSMSNVYTFFKDQVSSTRKSGMPEDEAKAFLMASIDQFIDDRIVISGALIVDSGVRRIRDGDVILTYAMSHIVERILVTAHRRGLRFRVVLVDARPVLEGKVLLQRLVAAGLTCTYVLLPALGYVLSTVSKVFLGAHSVLANGSILARVGSAVVGVMAKQYRVPLIVCCESYKFSEGVQLDSFTSNELGDPNELIATGRDDARFGVASLMDWRDAPSLHLLNLKYDMMPAQFVNMIITEVGDIPPTAVPVILREYKDYNKSSQS